MVEPLLNSAPSAACVGRSPTFFRGGREDRGQHGRRRSRSPLLGSTGGALSLAAFLERRHAVAHPPREAAGQLGWTYETARTTLKRVMAKVGVERQAELVGLLSGARSLS